VVLMLSLGLRRGEALGLAWDDVDLDAGALRVRRALKRERDVKTGRSRLVLGDVKTAGSRRSLNVPTPMVDMLRGHRRRQAEERLAVGAEWQDSGLVFTTPIGTPIDPANFRHAFAALCKRAGLGHWHPHELRHSAASIMLAQGVPLEVVSGVLGHSSIRMTKDVYGHIMAPQREAAAEAMGRALWGWRRS
jgi:integrase